MPAPARSGTLAAMRLQLANPADHPDLAALPWTARLDDWSEPHMHGVLGLHRHVVRLIEVGDVSYVIKELPDPLVEREYRLLRPSGEPVWVSSSGCCANSPRRACPPRKSSRP